MCINFDPLPEVVQNRIKMAAGRNKVMNFATGLVNWLYENNGKAHVGRQALIRMLGYKNANQIAKYVGIMIKAGIITKGDSYKVGRNGKCYYVNQDVMIAMHDARNTGRST